MGKVRGAFRAAGFGVPDDYARLAADLCDGAFTAEDFIADDNRAAELRLANPEVRGNQTASEFASKQILQQRRQALDPRELYERFNKPLVLAQIAELESAGEPAEPFLRTATDIRKYGETLAKEAGFAVKINRNALAYKRCLIKQMPQTGLVGAVVFDTGGRHNMGMTAGGEMVQFAGYTNFYSSFGADVESAQVGHRMMTDIISGIREYGFVHNARGRKAFNDFSGTTDLDLVSKTAKWGVRAQLCFFDCLLSQIDADL